MQHGYDQRPGASVNPKKAGLQPVPSIKTEGALIRQSEPDETPRLAGP